MMELKLNTYKKIMKKVKESLPHNSNFDTPIVLKRLEDQTYDFVVNENGDGTTTNIELTYAGSNMRGTVVGPVVVGPVLCLPDPNPASPSYGIELETYKSDIKTYNTRLTEQTTQIQGVMVESAAVKEKINATRCVTEKVKLIKENKSIVTMCDTLCTVYLNLLADSKLSNIKVYLRDYIAKNTGQNVQVDEEDNKLHRHESHTFIEVHDGDEITLIDPWLGEVKVLSPEADNPDVRVQCNQEFYLYSSYIPNETPEVFGPYYSRSSIETVPSNLFSKKVIDLANYETRANLQLKPGASNTLTTDVLGVKLQYPDVKTLRNGKVTPLANTQHTNLQLELDAINQGWIATRVPQSDAYDKVTIDIDKHTELQETGVGRESATYSDIDYLKGGVTFTPNDSGYGRRLRIGTRGPTEVVLALRGAAMLWMCVLEQLKKDPKCGPNAILRSSGIHSKHMFEVDDITLAALRATDLPNIDKVQGYRGSCERFGYCNLNTARAIMDWVLECCEIRLEDLKFGNNPEIYSGHLPKYIDNGCGYDSRGGVLPKSDIVPSNAEAIQAAINIKTTLQMALNGDVTSCSKNIDLVRDGLDRINILMSGKKLFTQEGLGVSDASPEEWVMMGKLVEQYYKDLGNTLETDESTSPAAPVVSVSTTPFAAEAAEVTESTAPTQNIPQP